MKVFVLMQGEYSDKRICGVYSDEAIPRRIAWAIGDYHAHEFELDGKPEIDRMPPEGMRSFTVEMDLEGNLVRPPHASHWWPSQLPEWGSQRRSVISSCWARDEAHAIKIAGEWRIRFLLEKEAEAAAEKLWEAKQAEPLRDADGDVIVTPGEAIKMTTEEE